MTEIKLSTNTAESVIHCGSGAFSAFASELKDRRLFIVTDKNVYKNYSNLLSETFGGAPVKVIPAGERNKNIRRLTEILQSMTDSGMKRNGTVIAFGGGVVGDIAGLAASLYMRGVKLVQIPTTLLSQVDSSVGGKTAVDFNNVKNLLGTFYQPEQVIVDPRFLSTLPSREIKCGLGEIIKYGALDKNIYEKLLKNSDNLYDFEFLEEITADCIRCKADVVLNDERDLNGIRKTLNLGHTTGHAFELYYGGKSHGEFVLIGAYYEMFIAEALKSGGGRYFENLLSLIKKVIKKIPAYADIEKAALFAKFDKKNEADAKISLIVPKSEGECRELVIGIDDYISLLAECRDAIKAGL